MNSFFDVFISYGRADSKVFATKLHKELLSQGLKVWFDQNDIPLGVDFQNQINDGIEKAHNFIFIIAPHSVKSPYCLKEIQLAVKCNKRIIPLLHVEPKDCWDKMHPTIGKINWIYFQEDKDDFEAAFAGLINLIGRHTDYVEQHTRFLAKALEWERHQKQTSCLLIGEERLEAESWLKIRFKDEQPPCSPSALHCEFITESIKNANNLMTQVFLSYADVDRATMEQIRNSLRRESITVWTNKSDIQTGEAFQEAVNRGIEQADNVVYLRSPNSVESDYCQKELEYALSLSKRIIPVLVGETDSEKELPALRSLQYIDLTDNVKEEDYLLDESQLLRILRQDAAYYNEHKILLVKALKWQRQHSNPSILLRGYNLRHAEAWLKVAKQRSQHPPTLLQEEFITESLRQPPAASMDVFISYSRADSDLARKLNDVLQIQGKTTWFDQESIASGSDFQQEIYRGIKACDNFLFILSPRSVTSHYCADEVEYAAQLHKRFITLLHREVNSAILHPELAKVQWIDFNQNEQDFNANFNQLVRTLDTDREHVHSHTQWLQRALEWKEKNQSADLLLRGSELAVAQAWLKETQEQNKQPAATDLQKEYIAKSGRYKRKNRRLLIGAAVSVMGVVTTAAVVSTIFWLKAERQAKIMTLREKASRVQILLPVAPVEALILAINVTGESQFSSPQVFKEVWPQVQFSLYDVLEVVRERNVLRAHQGWVKSVTFSPDGKTIVSSSRDGTLRLWDSQGNPISQPFNGNQRSVNSVAFSPDGKFIVSGGADGTIRLWDSQGNSIGQPFKGNQRSVNSVAFSPDGKFIVSGGDDRTVRLWDRQGNPIGQPFKGHGGKVKSVDFSQDGKLIVSGGFDRTVRLWDRQGNPIGQPFKGLQDVILSVAFSPDGKYIASGVADGTVRLWDRQGNPISQPFKGHQRSVNSIAFSPDGKQIVSGGEDGTVRLWDRQGNPIGQFFKGHRGTVNSVAFSPDGKHIISGSNDGTVRLWYSQGKVLGQSFTGYRRWVNSVAFSPDGKLIVSGNQDGTVQLWDNQGSPIGKSFKGHQGKIHSIAFSPNSKLIVSGGADQTVRLWDRQGNPIGQPFQGHGGWVHSVAFSPDGKLIASGAQDGRVRLWNIQGNLIGQPFKTLQGRVNSIAFSPDGKLIVSGGEKGTVRLWNIQGNSIGQPFKGLQGRVKSVAFSPGGKLIVIGGEDGTVRLWNIQDNLIGQPLTGHQGWVNSVAFSPDGKLIVSGGDDGTVRLWDSQTNSSSQPLTGHQGGVSSVAFNPDGKQIVSGGADGTLRLWRGGNWQIWLAVACNSLREHAVLVEPETILDDPETIKGAKAAHSTCQQFVWSKTKNAQ